MSLALDPGRASSADHPAQELPIEILHAGEGVRSGGLDEHHVRLLMETVDDWPAVVVWGDDYTIIDGAHRVEAARRLGHLAVPAVRFIGTHDEAFIESVRRNVKHGLPLSVSDRRRAAFRVLSRNPEWSDRRIASLCGLSGKTVARLRREGTGGNVVVPMARRVGRDGKVRPVRSREIQERIRRALEENPAGSLRFIAAIAGASPETVRSVRARMLDSDRATDQSVESPSVLTRISNRAATAIIEPVDDPPSDISEVKGDAWLSDAALNTCGDGGDFARWFTNSSVNEDWHRFIWAIPVGRIYEVVDEARRRAATWTAFASILESRIR